MKLRTILELEDPLTDEEQARRDHKMSKLVKTKVNGKRFYKVNRKRMSYMDILKHVPWQGIWPMIHAKLADELKTNPNADLPDPVIRMLLTDKYLPIAPVYVKVKLKRRWPEFEEIILQKIDRKDGYPNEDRMVGQWKYNDRFNQAFYNYIETLSDNHVHWPEGEKLLIYNPFSLHRYFEGGGDQAWTAAATARISSELLKRYLELTPSLIIRVLSKLKESGLYQRIPEVENFLKNETKANPKIADELRFFGVTLQ